MRSRAGLSVAGLMTVVAVIALSLAAFRLHFSLGCFVGVLSILSIYRYQVIETTCRKIGQPLERRERPATFAQSFMVSFVILTLASSTAISIYTIGAPLEDGRRSHGSPVPNTPITLLFALVAAWYIARRGRIDLWPSPRCTIPSRDQRPKEGTGASPDVVVED